MTAPKKLSDKVISILTSRLKDEYTAHYIYNAAANWCNDKAYFNAGKYFADESADELNHALDIQGYLVQWNIIPVVPTVETNYKFSSLVEVIEKAYEIEYDLWTKYNENSKSVLVADPSTFDFLAKYREIQTKSVAEFSDLLNALQLVNTDNGFELLYFEQTFFK